MAHKYAASRKKARAAYKARALEQGKVELRVLVSQEEAKWARAELAKRANNRGTEAALRQELADLKKEIEDPKRKAAERRKRIAAAAATFAATVVATAMIQLLAFGFQPFSPAHLSALALRGLGGTAHGLPLALSFIGAWWAWRVANALVCEKLLRVPLHEGGQAYWLATHWVVLAGGLWGAWTAF